MTSGSVNNSNIFHQILPQAETYSEPCQTFKMELSPKMLNGFQSLNIFAKCSILDIQQGSDKPLSTAHTSKITVHTTLSSMTRSILCLLSGLISFNISAMMISMPLDSWLTIAFQWKRYISLCTNYFHINYISLPDMKILKS